MRGRADLQPEPPNYDVRKIEIHGPDDPKCPWVDAGGYPLINYKHVHMHRPNGAEICLNVEPSMGGGESENHTERAHEIVRSAMIKKKMWPYPVPMELRVYSQKNFGHVGTMRLKQEQAAADAMDPIDIRLAQDQAKANAINAAEATEIVKEVKAKRGKGK